MRRNRKNKMTYLLLFLLLGIGLGYAFLTQELTINGISKISSNRWNIYFDNLDFNPDNVTLSSEDASAEINASTLTDISYTITLQKPGDFYEFTVDVINDGTIDAMIDSISSKYNGVEIDNENPLPNYLKYNVTYGDGVALEKYQLLKQGTTDSYKVRLEYNKDITSEDLPDTIQTITINFKVNYVQADKNAVQRNLRTFSTDSWEDIISNIQAGRYYEVGLTKEVELGNGLGTHTLRVANNTSPDECYTEEFSQTACGFVLEFADIITTHNMNSTDTNIGGWVDSEMRTFLNDEDDSSSIYNSLPTVIKNAIIVTSVISGYEKGHYEEGNYYSVDKLFLLAGKEIGVSSSLDAMIDFETRMLDYYKKIGVTWSDFSGTFKANENGENVEWWQRSAAKENNESFISTITSSWGTSVRSSSNDYGVSPAFRLAGPSSYGNRCDAFENDSWEAIINNVKSNHYTQYAVGCTKTITLGNELGTHKLRVANQSISKECSDADFSQSTCGFVLEFADVITTHRMNPGLDYHNINDRDGTGSVGGWPASEMRTYLNDENDSTSIINSLPSVIRNAIINTTVVSGHGSEDMAENYKSSDKLFLLSLHEVWEDVDGNPNGGISSYDSSYQNTKQLDYYRLKKLTYPDSNYGNLTIKYYNNASTNWWLRSAEHSQLTSFIYLISQTYNFGISQYTNGVSPAFRLAGPKSTYVDPCQAFKDDSWETIVENAHNNNYSQYKVGCKKKVSLGNGLGEQNVRVANNSTPTECSTPGFSQTACGFVLEFTRIISKHVMNSTINNIGGWPASEMRTYINNINDSTSIINSLPSVIKNGIIDTTVVSGAGCGYYNNGCVERDNLGENYTTVDKLYLLSPHELYKEIEGSTYGGKDLDISYNMTRQLDYYKKIGVTIGNKNPTTSDYEGNYLGLSKQYNDSNAHWWLRTPNSNSSYDFHIVIYDGEWGESNSHNVYGVSPAFRLGGPSSSYVSPCQNFNTDSWSTIVSNVQSGNYSRYPVGCSKSVSLNGLGNHNLRIANNSNYNCNLASKTACGFVLEFEDIITTHKMNPYDSNSVANGNGNIGGWPMSEMRTYLNNTNDSSSIINSLPSSIKNAIINTTVVSGHGSTSGETNFTSTDKLYLLSTKEVYGKNGTTNIIDYDSAETETRQLDLYSRLPVSTSFYRKATKYYNNSIYPWHLRTAYLNNNSNYYAVDPYGYWNITYNSTTEVGVSPAFRLG